MGVGYILVSHTKRESVGFHRVPASKKRELAGNPAAAAIVTWHLLENAGDEVAFVTDCDEDWPFSGGGKRDLGDYPDLTARVIDALLAEGILEGRGKEHFDPDDPEGVYERDLRNVWMDGPG